MSFPSAINSCVFNTIKSLIISNVHGNNIRDAVHMNEQNFYSLHWAHEH